MQVIEKVLLKNKKLEELTESLILHYFVMFVFYIFILYSTNFVIYQMLEY